MSILRLAHRAVGTAVILSALTVAVPAASAQRRAAPPGQEIDTIEAFQKRVHEYVLLHRTTEGQVGKLPDAATPAQIDRFQRELGRRLILARQNARAGDLFGPDGGAVIRRLLDPVFTSPDGPRIRKEISDGESHAAPPRVNARYPDAVPLSTMPPAVLLALPKLEEEIEYRFIGRHLILLDPHAHLVVDVLTNVIPA